MYSLFYADYVVLISESEVGLLNLLQTADSFAKMWGMQFSEKKSQILITSKWISNKQWHIGELNLAETNSYKYLGVTINRLLKDNDHVTKHLADKCKKLEAYIRYTLSNNMDSWHIEFGNTLWDNALLASLSHASSMWFNGTKNIRDTLESMQHRCAKAVLKLHCNHSRLATLGDLGWLPIIL